MARIVLDTDVVSHHRAGRLPAEYARLVTTSQHCVAFATAAELWKGALTSDGAVPAVPGSIYGWPESRLLPPACEWPRSGARSPPARSDGVDPGH